MTMTHPAPDRDDLKWAMFTVMALPTLGVMWTDERFLIDKADEEWAHIAPFQWWLLPHGLAGFAALLIRRISQIREPLPVSSLLEYEKSEQNLCRRKRACLPCQSHNA